MPASDDNPRSHGEDRRSTLNGFRERSLSDESRAEPPPIVMRNGDQTDGDIRAHNRRGPSDPRQAGSFDQRGETETLGCGRRVCAASDFQRPGSRRSGQRQRRWYERFGAQQPERAGQRFECDPGLHHRAFDGAACRLERLRACQAPRPPEQPGPLGQLREPTTTRCVRVECFRS